MAKICAFKARLQRCESSWLRHVAISLSQSCQSFLFTVFYLTGHLNLCQLHVLAMDSGRLIGLCLAALAFFVIVPWSLAVTYRRRTTPNKPRKPKKVVENANSYRRYEEYTILIICWGVAISAYIAVLDRAVNHPTFMGPKGSGSRNISFQVLSFVRTGFAVIHLPLMTTVLAATVPYWTMAKLDRHSVPETASPPPTEASDGLGRPTRVIQLFYLADKTWSGLIGWVTTSIYGWKEGGLSLTWAILAMIAALSYAGFPLLSLAYVSSSTQYWEPGTMPATVRIGGLSSSYNSTLRAMYDKNRWMMSIPFLNTTLNADLIGFNSSSPDATPFHGIANQSYWFPWADNQTVFTLSPNTAENKQLPLAGIRAFVSCGFNNYSVSNPVLPSGLTFDNVKPDTNSGSLYKLRCVSNCTDLGNSSTLACSTQSSVINVTYFDYDESGYSNVGPTFQSQALSCVQQEYNDLQSVANILLAVQGPNASTQAANCSMSVTYVRPTVNTLIGSYIESTSSATPDIVLDASPLQLLNLSISPFVNFFHQGPPPLTVKPIDNTRIDNCSLPAISSGFAWISDWFDYPCTYNITDQTTPAALLTDSELGSEVCFFSESVFLGPLASLINDPSFFKNGTVVGVTFKTEPGLSYGKVPALLAVLVLAVPVLCTIALSVVTNTQRRWTASLDAFSIFKLGADWRGNVESQKMVSLGKASSHVREIPGTVVVSPETGGVELARVPERRRLSRLSRYVPEGIFAPQG